MKELFMNRSSWQRYWKSLKFSMYCITHPLDGFWDLTHEKRGTYAAANTILILTLIARSLSSGRDLKKDHDLFI